MANRQKLGRTKSVNKAVIGQNCNQDRQVRAGNNHKNNAEQSLTGGNEVMDINVDIDGTTSCGYLV